MLNENKRLNDVVEKFQNHIIKTSEGESNKQRSNIVMIPDRTGIVDDKSRILTSFGPTLQNIQTYSKIVPLSPLHQGHQNLTKVSRIRGTEK